MVKQAEKDTRKNPLLPIYGLIIAVGLFSAALLITLLVTDSELSSTSAGLRAVYAKSGMGVPALTQAVNGLGTNRLAGVAGIAFAMWLVMLAIAYAGVAILAGRDPQRPKKMREDSLPDILRKKKP
jgi:hypothetical protein